MATAIAGIGMSLDDFEACTIDELTAICKCYTDKQETEYHSRWELMRMLAAITIQPHCKQKISPQRLLPFPWEKNKSKKPTPTPTPRLTKEQQLARVKKLLHKQ